MLAELYHDNTCLTPKTARQFVEAIEMPTTPPRPHGFPRYPAIPLKNVTVRIRLDKAMAQRVSTRVFSEKAVSFRALSAMLVTALGTGAAKPDGLVQRPHPSAGALYPVSCFLLARNVQQLASGVYNINGDKKALEFIGDQSAQPDVFHQLLQRAILADSGIHRAAFYLLLTGDMERATGKYGDRGYRFLLLEAGHIAQNLSLAAGGCGIQHVALGGFCERELEQLVGVHPAGHRALYVLAFGHGAP